MTSFTWLPDAAWRGALLLSIAFVVARLLKAHPAAVRHVLWTGALAGVMAMPLLTVVAPSVPVAVPQRVPQISSPAAPDNSLGSTEFANEDKDVERASPSASATDSPILTSTIQAVTTPWYRWMSPVTWAIVIWLVGVLAFSIRLLVGFMALSRMRRNGRDVEDSVAELADACAARLGLHDGPRVIVSPRVAMPCAAGWIKPVIVLPEGHETWTRERLEIVLLHELSHIRRMDIVPHILSEFTRVIYWFNPLVWLAAARLRAEAEMATDDRVVHAGAKPSDYAAHLLDIVRQSRRIWHPAPMMPLARRSEFEGRMLAILESGGNRASTRWALGMMALAAGLSLGVASVEGAAAKPVAFNEGPDESGVLPESFHVEATSEFFSGRKEQKEEKETTFRESRPSLQGAAAANESVMGALAEALRDPVPAVREAAVQALGNARDSVAVRALMEVLRSDESPSVRRSAAWALGEIADDLAIPALTEALTRDRDVDVRKNAASALGSIDSPRATSALIQALENDANASVRQNAAEALANIEDPAAVDALIRVLDRDDNPGVKREVISAIDNLDATRAVPAVSGALRDSDAAVRRAAAEALGGMEDEDAVPALIAVARDAEPGVRRAVMEALQRLGDRRALQTFIGGLSDADAEVRHYAAEGIGNMENLRTAPPELIRAMEDRNDEVRHAAAHALGHIKDPAGMRALIAHVSDPNVEVRQAVVESLDEFDDPAVTAALRTALKDTNAEVRQSAVRALGNRNRSK
jgi:HEAT repeat protein/beta-lactamase regulating signal transducer with metallopeptidase domain